MPSPLVIDQRYRGFDRVVQGGYSSGLLAARLGSAASIKLRAPVPMGVELTVEPGEDGVALRGESGVLAEATALPGGLDLEPPRPVSVVDAERVSADYPGHRGHPYPGCFCCGPAREPGDGLRIFPGSIDGGDLLAAPWTPDPGFAVADGLVRPEIVWAAFDCPQLWALMLSAPADSTDHVVTAALETEIRAPVRAGERHTIVSWPLGVEGRRFQAAAALLDEAEETLAVSRQTAVLAPAGVPLGLAWMDA
jgi:hypothetical protein